MQSKTTSFLTPPGQLLHHFLITSTMFIIVYLTGHLRHRAEAGLVFVAILMASLCLAKAYQILVSPAQLRAAAARLMDFVAQETKPGVLRKKRRRRSSSSRTQVILAVRQRWIKGARPSPLRQSCSPEDYDEEAVVEWESDCQPGSNTPVHTALRE